MKFRDLKKTPNGFIIGRWYKDADIYNNRDLKWKVVDHKKIKDIEHNVWSDSIITHSSKFVFCYSSNEEMWPKGTVIRVSVSSLIKN